MQNIKMTGQGTVSLTAPYMLCGATLFAGTSCKITDAADREVMGVSGVGDRVLPGPIAITGMKVTGTFTDLQIYVE